MWSKITEISLKNRLLTLACMVAVVIIGFRMFQSAPIDVYPDINPPRITILTEAHGVVSRRDGNLGYVTY